MAENPAIRVTLHLLLWLLQHTLLLSVLLCAPWRLTSMDSTTGVPLFSNFRLALANGSLDSRSEDQRAGGEVRDLFHNSHHLRWSPVAVSGCIAQLELCPGGPPAPPMSPYHYPPPPMSLQTRASSSPPREAPECFLSLVASLNSVHAVYTAPFPMPQ